jgi:hypothetical protein
MFNAMRYSFLVKPIFFIVNLVFATWLVLAIEQVRPSDFEQHKSIFSSPEKPKKVYPSDKPRLRKLAEDYKAGKIDASTLDKELDAFLAPIK